MIFRRIYLEWKYFTKRPWTLNEVGKFWDQVDDYDDIKEKKITLPLIHAFENAENSETKKIKKMIKFSNFMKISNKKPGF